jgi:hypothetical protein
LTEPNALSLYVERPPHAAAPGRTGLHEQIAIGVREPKRSSKSLSQLTRVGVTGDWILPALPKLNGRKSADLFDPRHERRRPRLHQAKHERHHDSRYQNGERQPGKQLVLQAPVAKSHQVRSRVNM